MIAAVRGWLGRHALARAGLVFVAGALLGGLLVWAPWSGDGPAHGRFDFESTAVPGEYMYLDPERVVAYLAQIRGGIPGAETQTETLEESVGASAGTAVSGTFQRRREAGVSRQVTATTAADFLSLLDKLRDGDLQRPVRVREIDARPEPPSAQAFADGVLALREGDFVVIRDARVLMPVHVRPYDAIRRLGPASFSADPAVRAEIRRYAATVGADPRIVFNIGAHTSKDDGAPLAAPLRLANGGVVLRPGCPTTAWPSFGRVWPPEDPVNARILLPVRYSLIAPESSLLSGGDSIVVGKVIRVLRPPTTATPGPQPRESDVCYRDREARNVFGLTAARIPEAVTSTPEGPSRRAVERALVSYAGVRAPAAVVVPVAIYR